MLHRDTRSIPNITYKITSRGPVCLVACRDTRLALMIARALEEQHYPVVLVPSALGFLQPLLLHPDVLIMDEAMVQELEVIGGREVMRFVSRSLVVFLGAGPDGTCERSWLQPQAKLPLSAGAADIVQTVYMLAQAEPADGRSINALNHGHGFGPTLPIPAVSW